MARIHEFTTVACPFDEIAEKLCEHFHGGDAGVPLRVQVRDLRVEREVDGSYRPPFGLAGAAFDALIGQRIAQNTAAQLLDELKRILQA